jgi:hypothetical protein
MASTTIWPTLLHAVLVLPVTPRFLTHFNHRSPLLQQQLLLAAGTKPHNEDRDLARLSMEAT